MEGIMTNVETILETKIDKILKKEDINFVNGSFIHTAFLAHLSDLVSGKVHNRTNVSSFGNRDLTRANRIVENIVKMIDRKFDMNIDESDKYLILIYVQSLIEVDQKEKTPAITLVFSEAKNLLTVKELITSEFAGTLPLKMHSIREYKLSNHEDDEKIYITDDKTIKGNYLIFWNGNGDELMREIRILLRSKK